MTQASELPLHMRREGFQLGPDLLGLRETGEVPRVRVRLGMEAWLITRHEDVRRVFADPVTFANDPRKATRRLDVFGASEEERRQALAGNLLALDPPEHTRLRKALAGAFTVRRMRALEPRVAEIVDEHLDAMQAKGRADLVADFALPIPSLVICELLGVPYADRDSFQARTAKLVDVSLPADELFAEARRMREYMLSLVRQARADPGDDLIGALVQHGSDFTDDELAGMGNLLLIAGHETTANMLGLGTLALLRHPDQLAALRADPDLIGNAIEELLRWLSIVHTGTLKIATADTEINGHPIVKGDLLVVSIPMANRDPAAVDDPDRLDLSRPDIAHLAFGHGIHHCLGAPLARMELRTAFPALLNRFPDLRLAPGAEPAFRSFSVVYGVAELPVEW
ncbi:cytochrome P450 [Actinokineospora pegani]|uniref:cytochrome P450 n=1 Tax=Actinokineospora pegani TaxID=2654637 RepID=UPI001F46EBC8|nr:cytochrome P450 [Actinokineospora pegani]